MINNNLLLFLGEGLDLGAVGEDKGVKFHIAIDIKYLVVLDTLRLSEHLCTAQEGKEKRSDSTGRHFENNKSHLGVMKKY